MTKIFATAILLICSINLWGAQSQKGVTLLGRDVKPDKKSLHFEYIVVDTTKDNAVISTPRTARTDNSYLRPMTQVSPVG